MHNVELMNVFHPTNDLLKHPASFILRDPASTAPLLFHLHDVVEQLAILHVLHHQEQLLRGFDDLGYVLGTSYN